MKTGIWAGLKRLAYIASGLVLAGLVTYVAAIYFPDVTLVSAGLATIVFLIMLLRPPKLVMQSRLFVMVLLVISAFGIGKSASVINAAEDKVLSDLKMANPDAYVDELKALGRNKEWFAALKEIRPEEHQAELARRSDETRLEQVRKDEQAEQDRLNQLSKNAGNDDRHVITLRATDYKGIWNLSPLEGQLRCEHGPMYSDKPRPFVLFEAGGVTYGVNGAAMGKGGYPDARTLLSGEAGHVPYDLKMIHHLLKAGLAMC